MNSKNNPASVDALSRISEETSLYLICIYIVTHDLDESNVVAASADSPGNFLESRASIGRVDAGAILAGLFDAGVVSESDQTTLQHAVKLVEQETDLTIDPLLEVARRVLEKSLVAGGWRG